MQEKVRIFCKKGMGPQKTHSRNRNSLIICISCSFIFSRIAELPRMWLIAGRLNLPY